MTTTQRLYVLIEVLMRRRRRFWHTAAAVFAIIAVGTLLMPPTYESVSKVLIQDNRAQLLVSPSLPASSSNQPTVLANPVSEQDLNSELELLTSPELVEGAVADLPLPARRHRLAGVLVALHSLVALPASGYRALHDTPELTARQQWAIELARYLSSGVIKRSNVIQVSFRAQDPVWARDFLNRLLAQYLEIHARLAQDPQAEEFFEKQAALLRLKLHQSEERLRAMEVQTGITSLDAQKQALLQQLSSFEADYHKNDAQRAAIEQQIVSLQREMATVPHEETKETKRVQNMALQTLKPQVLELEAERGELLSRYRPESERIKEIDAKLAAARAILNRENHTEIQEVATDVNPLWSSLEDNLAHARVALAALQASQQELAKQTDDYRQRLKALASDGIVIEQAHREVDLDKEAYLSYVRKSEEARAAGALNQSKILNVSIAQAPSTPLQPVFPKLGVNLCAGTLLGLILGMAAAWWEERRDPRLFSEVAVTEASGLTTIAVLPNSF